MTTNETEQAAKIFHLQLDGWGISDPDKSFLQGLLDRMEEPEKAGCIAAIIKIMLG